MDVTALVIAGIALFGFMVYLGYTSNVGVSKGVAELAKMNRMNENLPWTDAVVYDGKYSFQHSYNYTEFINKIKTHFDAEVVKLTDYGDNSQDVYLKVVRKNVEHPPIYIHLSLEVPNSEIKYTTESEFIADNIYLYYNLKDSIKKEMLLNSLNSCLMVEIPRASIDCIQNKNSISKKYVDITPKAWVNARPDLIDTVKRNLPLGTLMHMYYGKSQTGKSHFLNYIAVIGFPNTPMFEIDPKQVNNFQYRDGVTAMIKARVASGSAITISFGQQIFGDLSSIQLTELTEWMSGTELYDNYKINFVCATHETLDQIPEFLQTRFELVEFKPLTKEQFLQHLSSARPSTEWSYDMTFIDSKTEFNYSDIRKAAKLK